MIKKYLGITLISASLAFAGCSSNDDDDGGDIDNMTDTGAGAGAGEQTDGGETEAPDVGPEAPTPAPAPAGEVVVPMEFDPGPDVAGSITEALTNAGNFTILLGAVDASGLGGALADGSIRTVFAPNDAALQPLVDAGQIPTDQELLQGLVLGHTINGALDGNLVAASVGQTVTTANGNSLAITEGEVTDGGTQLLIAGVPILATDLNSATGIVHTIDGVIGITGADAATPPAEGEGEGDGEAAPVDGGQDPNADNLGPNLNNLNDLGFTGFVTAFAGSTLGQAFDENPWTAFVPSNAAIGDADALAAAGNTFAFNHLLGSLSIVEFGELSALGATTSFGGDASVPAIDLVFGGTPAAPTVNGFAISPIDGPGPAVLYEIDGLLQ